MCVFVVKFCCFVVFAFYLLSIRLLKAVYFENVLRAQATILPSLQYGFIRQDSVHGESFPGLSITSEIEADFPQKDSMFCIGSEALLPPEYIP